MAYEWPVLAVPAWLYDPTHDDGPSQQPSSSQTSPDDTATPPRPSRGRRLASPCSLPLHLHGCTATALVASSGRTAAVLQPRACNGAAREVRAPRNLCRCRRLSPRHGRPRERCRAHASPRVAVMVGDWLAALALCLLCVSCVWSVCLWGCHCGGNVEMVWEEGVFDYCCLNNPPIPPRPACRAGSATGAT
jgi:hypothetical protein